MGSPVVAAWIANLAFWVLMFVGWRGLGRKRAAIFVALWLAAFVGRPFVPYGAALFSPYVAVLDIALVFAIFKGDLRLF